MNNKTYIQLYPDIDLVITKGPGKLKTLQIINRKTGLERALGSYSAKKIAKILEHIQEHQAGIKDKITNSPVNS